MKERLIGTRDGKYCGCLCPKVKQVFVSNEHKKMYDKYRLVDEYTHRSKRPQKLVRGANCRGRLKLVKPPSIRVVSWQPKLTPRLLDENPLLNAATSKPYPSKRYARIMLAKFGLLLDNVRI